MDTNNTNSGGAGPIIGTIIILAIVIIGGLYFLGQRNPSPTTDIYGNPVSSSTSSTVDNSQTNTQATSTTGTPDYNSTMNGS